MSRFSVTSSKIMGILEDIEINRISGQTIFTRSLDPSCDDEIRNLCLSIKQFGLINPIVVRSNGVDLEVVCGTRRYSACKILGWRKILCHIVELSDKEAFEVSLNENMNRKSLNPIEEARAFETYTKTRGWGGISELALKIGRSASYVHKRIQLLSLPSEVQDRILSDSIKASIAEELLYIRDKNKIDSIAKYASQDRLSLKKVRCLVKKYNITSCERLSLESTLLNDINTTMEESNVGIDEIDRETQRSFDKTILTIRFAMRTLNEIMNNIEDNWIVYETLRAHRNMLHSQIDLLIKQKKKYTLDK